MHLCTISVDRYLSLRYPMRFGRHKTRKRVMLKLMFVWCLSLATSMPVSLMYATDTKSTIVDGVCQIPVSLFQIIGSLFAFYIPLVIMLVTYALTVRLLSQKESELNAMGLDTPITPLSHSVRLKRLLCKTTSTLSSTTATSIADTELSEAAQSEEIESESNNSPKRPPYIRYASHFRSGNTKMNKNYVIKEKNLSVKSSSNKRMSSYDCHLRPPISGSASAELQIFPKYNEGEASSLNAYSSTLPKGKVKGLSPNGLRNHKADKKQKDMLEANQMVEIRISESTPIDSPLQDDGDSEGLNGTSVTVPCSCAPRFFLEGLSRNNTTASSDMCGDCTHIDRIPSITYESDDLEGQRRTKKTFFTSIFSKIFICHKENETAESSLESPWHEERRPSPCPSETIIRPAMRSNVYNRSPTKSTVSSISPSFQKVSRTGNERATPSNRSTWRTRSCTASMRFVSSKRHGRNIRMEQKATKVLGIVFFTFVILWAPFFIINLMLGACATCIHLVSEDVINFVTWLGYISSMVNPFFYTFFNKSFRDAFTRILKCNIRNKRKYNF